MTKSTPFNIAVGQNIRRRRRMLDISQKTIAVRLKIPVSMQQMQKYEKGMSALTAERLSEIALILGCTTEELLP